MPSPQFPHVVRGTIRDSSGSPTAGVRLTFTTRTGSKTVFSESAPTSSIGEYNLDLANIGYSDGETVSYSATDKYGEQIISSSFVVSGGDTILDIVLEVRDVTVTMSRERHAMQLYNIAGEPIHHDNPLPVEIPEGTVSTVDVQLQKTAFGELAVSELTPLVHLQFPYNVNAALVISRANQSGVIDTETSMARLQSGAAASSSAEILSRNPVKYTPGQGNLIRFTAVYSDGVAGNEQLAGVGDTGDGLFFGFVNADFGIVHRRSGTSEVRTLTVSTKSTDNEDITITLNGVAKTDVAVTDASGGDKTTTANDIAGNDYSDVGRGWDAFAVGDTVIFVSWCAGVRSGTYSLTDSQSSAGTFAQTLAGLDDVQDFIIQSDWNEDTCDGGQTYRNPSGMLLNPKKGNIYEIKYQWLGFGALEFFIENPESGRVDAVHIIKYPNANTVPSLNNPSLQLYAGSLNKANDTNIILKIGSMMGGTEGRDEQTGSRRGVKGTKTLTGVSDERPIMSIRNKLVYQSTLNRTEARIFLVGASVEHTKPVTINFYANVKLTAASFSDLSTNTSILQTDTSATSFTGGVLLFSIDLGKVGQDIIVLADKNEGLLLPGNVITATAQPSSGNGAEANVAFNTVEFF